VSIVKVYRVLRNLESKRNHTFLLLSKSSLPSTRPASPFFPLHVPVCLLDHPHLLRRTPGLALPIVDLFACSVMVKPTSADAASPGGSPGTTKATASPSQNAVAWGLICLYSWFECKERQVEKSDQLNTICAELAKKHAALFVEGRSAYDHPECAKLRAEAVFSPDELCRSSDGNTIKRKGQLVERDIKNVLVPALYESCVLDPPNYTIASGKNAEDLLLDVKRLAWVKNGKPDAEFKDGFASNAYHTSFFPFLVATPFSEYLYERPGHPFFDSCKKGPRAASAPIISTEKAKLGRAAQREKNRKKRKEAIDNDDEDLSTAASATSILYFEVQAARLKAEEAQRKADALRLKSENLKFLVVNSTSGQMKATAIKELAAITFSKPKHEPIEVPDSEVDDDGKDAAQEADEVSEMEYDEEA
jgi:hypothetical protein